jgi:hypothetical protein
MEEGSFAICNYATEIKTGEQGGKQQRTLQESPESREYRAWGLLLLLIAYLPRVVVAWEKAQ